ncbi:N-oxide-forming dimethylaniline monooxygenase [Tanacetum coccineum]
MIDYIHSYAKHFQLIPHIKFCSKVKRINYDGPSSDSWVLWNGSGEPFPPQGKWNITVENTKTATTEVYSLDFVILCIGRNKDVPNMPNFPQGRGLDVFQGKAVHSSQYAALDNDAAEQLVKGKKVVVVGLGKSGLDIARSCAEINGTPLKLADWHPWTPLINPCLITLLCLVFISRNKRWTLLKLIESHAKLTLPLAKYNMVPEQGLGEDMASGLLMHIPDPDDFFDGLKKGSIKLKKTPTYNMYEKGFTIVEQEEKTQIEADVAIFSTGFDGVEKECIHPRIPQLGIIGFSDGLSSLYTSEMRCKWLLAVLEGSVKLPNINEMQKNIKEWDEYMKRASGHNHYRSFLGSIEIWYSDVVCKDMGVNTMRKKGLFANMFEAYCPTDYADI